MKKIAQVTGLILVTILLTALLQKLDPVNNPGHAKDKTEMENKADTRESAGVIYLNSDKEKVQKTAMPLSETSVKEKNQ